MRLTFVLLGRNSLEPYVPCVSLYLWYRNTSVASIFKIEMELTTHLKFLSMLVWSNLLFPLNLRKQELLIVLLLWALTAYWHSFQCCSEWGHANTSNIRLALWNYFSCHSWEYFILILNVFMNYFRISYLAFWTCSPTSSQIHLSLHPYPPNFMPSFIFSENSLRGISVAFILLGMCLYSGAYYTYQMLCPQRTLILHLLAATITSSSSAGGWTSF